jgi:NADH:ubiquinone reductase (H+-translocating)
MIASDESPIAKRRPPAADRSEHRHRVVIVGGGFGGLEAVTGLAGAPVTITLIDQRNYHLFQPLLYQVATSILTPGQIGSPIRSILRNQPNTSVLMGEVIAVDRARQYVVVNDADRDHMRVHYDYLILATGASHNYFGHGEFEKYAPGLKNLADAVAVRNKVLQAFEQAEAEEDPARHSDLLTFILVGAGPTGVEMAGAIANLCRITLRSEFRRIDPASARVVLVDAGSRVLASFSEDVSAAAHKRLEELGVEVLLQHGVEQVDEEGVIVAGKRVASRTVIWTAGVTPSPAGRWLNAETDRSGRVRIGKDLTLPGHPEIFVVGDTATLDQDGRPLPGVAQVAIQQGRYAGRSIRRRLEGKAALKPFRYFDKGNMAVVGRGYAVLETGGLHISGFLAWLAWAGVHLQFLAQSSLRVSVFVQWVWTYLTGQRGSVLIINHLTGQHAGVRTEAPILQSSAPARNGPA